MAGANAKVCRLRIANRMGFARAGILDDDIRHHYSEHLDAGARGDDVPQSPSLRADFAGGALPPGNHSEELVLTARPLS